MILGGFKMNRWIMGTCVAAMLAAVPAMAGLNPADPGLPLADGFVAATASNGGSSMCVDCHTANPLAARTYAGAAKYAWQTAHADFLGSHFVGLGTNSGGGITNAGAGLAPRTGGEYFQTAAWTTSGGFSKYMNAAGDSVIADNSLQANVAVVGVANTDHITCESCHSIVVNVAGGRNLLGGGATDGSGTQVAGKIGGDNTGICEECHGDMTVASGNNSPDGNNHHVLSLATNAADIISDAKAAAGLLWTRAASATGTDGRSTNTDPAYAAGLMPEVGYQVRGTFNGSSWQGGLAGKDTGGAFNCTDCHAVGHGGRTDTGARIFRSGLATEVGNNVNSGIFRLEDSIQLPVVGVSTTVWTNDKGYCEGCHVYNK
jgi:hypothetical protein